MVSLVGSTSLVPTLGIPYDTYLKSIAGMDWFMTQELSGAVAYATNSALALGRNVAINGDFANWTGVAPNDSPDDWATVQVGDATSNVTQNPAGHCQIISDGTLTQIAQDALATGKTFRITVITTAVAAGGIQIFLGVGSTPVAISIATTTVIEGTAFSDSLIIRRNGPCDATISSITSEQTGILASSAYAPGTNPMDGTYTSVTLGGVADGNLGYAPLWDGVNDNLAVISAENNSKTDPTSYHELIWVQKDTWDATERDILSYTVDANNWIRIVDTTTPGTISWQHRAGGTTEEVTLATGSPTGWFLVGISVESGVMKAWYNYEQTGADQAVAGTFVGNFVTMNYGSRAGGHFHKGSLTRPGSATSELSVATVSDIYYGAQI